MAGTPQWRFNPFRVPPGFLRRRVGSYERAHSENRTRTARRAPARQRDRQPAESKSAWDKASVLVQAVGGLGIVVSVLTLYIGVREFNDQQAANAAQALDQQRQNTLDQFLDDLSSLVLQYQLPSSKPNSAERALATARTLTAVRDLDGSRKATIIRYLWEAGLITGRLPVISISGANLENGIFSNAHLSGADLYQLDLSYANFDGSNLSDANLNHSALFGTTLDQAELTDADLMDAQLIGASLNGATLTRTDFRGADLDGANFAGTTPGSADLKGATFNAEPAYDRNPQGTLILEKPTQWPPGFNPEAAGAICWDCEGGQK